MDGVVSYKSDKEPLPGRATLYSILLPGLGQIYNGELFKVPIYWGGLMASVHFLMNNNTNYNNSESTENHYRQLVAVIPTNERLLSILHDDLHSKQQNGATALSL